MAVYQVRPCSGGNLENWEIPESLGVPDIGDGVTCQSRENQCYNIDGDGDGIPTEVADSIFKPSGGNDGCNVCFNNLQIDELLITECLGSSPGYVSQWVREGNGSTSSPPSNQYLKTELYLGFPGTWPVPNDNTAVENMIGVLLDRTDLSNNDLNGTLTALDGLSGGTLVFNALNGDLAEYTITSTTYNSAYLYVEFGALVESEFTNFNNNSYGICINQSVAESLTPTPTPSITATPSVTATPSITATPSVTATPSITATPSVTATPSITATPS